MANQLSSCQAMCMHVHAAYCSGYSTPEKSQRPSSASWISPSLVPVTTSLCHPPGSFLPREATKYSHGASWVSFSGLWFPSFVKTGHYLHLKRDDFNKDGAVTAGVCSHPSGCPHAHRGFCFRRPRSTFASMQSLQSWT